MIINGAPAKRCGRNGRNGLPLVAAAIVLCDCGPQRTTWVEINIFCKGYLICGINWAWRLYE
jgi:hypothetical protein